MKKTIEYTQLFLIEEMAKFVRSKGYSRCVCTWYSSDQKEAGSADVLFAMRAINPAAKIYYFTMPEVISKNLDFSFTILNNIAKTSEIESYVTLGGSYIIILIPCRAEKTDQARRDSRKIAAVLRLFYGHKYALARHAEYDFHLDTNIINYISDPKWLPETDLLKEDYFDLASNKSQVVSINHRVFELLELANTTHDSTLRFAILWLAIEAQIGDGSARKAFCKNLDSKIIENEMERLRSLRNKIFHDGEKIEISPKDEYTSMSIIRISVLMGGETAKKLTDKLEKSLINQKEHKGKWYRRQIVMEK